MVMLRFRCKPGSEAAILNIRLTTSSPTLSKSTLMSPPSPTIPILQLRVHIRCTSSVHPSQPLTFCTSGTIFNTDRPEEGHMDNLALGLLGPGLIHTKDDGTRKAISLGYFRAHRARQNGDDAANLLERPNMSFVTVPSKDSGEELVLTHNISAERLFAYAENITPGDLQLGERYEMRTSDGYLGTMWWCWGSLDGKLKGKKLHAFREGFALPGYEERPSEDEINREGWVTGEDVGKLVFEFEEGGDRCSVEVVE